MGITKLETERPVFGLIHTESSGGAWSSPSLEQEEGRSCCASALSYVWFSMALRCLGSRDELRRVHDVVGIVAVQEAHGVSHFVRQQPLEVVRPSP